MDGPSPPPPPPDAWTHTFPSALMYGSPSPGPSSLHPAPLPLQVLHPFTSSPSLSGPSSHHYILSLSSTPLFSNLHLFFPSLRFFIPFLFFPISPSSFALQILHLFFLFPSWLIIPPPLSLPFPRHLLHLSLMQTYSFPFLSFNPSLPLSLLLLLTSYILLD